MRAGLGFSRTPRGNLLSAALGGVIGIVLGSGLAPASGQQTGERHLQPNIVLIVLDDVGTDKLRMYGESDSPSYALPPFCGALADPLPYPRTPTLEQLASGTFPGLGGGGLRFGRAYSAPVCTMARACMQTGRYGFRNGLGVVDDGLAQRQRMRNEEVLLPELLRAGFPTPTPGSLRRYRTGAFGKWHLSALPVCDPTLPSDFTHAVDNGFQLFQGTMANVGSPLSNPGDHYRWTKVTAVPGTTELTRYDVGAVQMAEPFHFSPACTVPGTRQQFAGYTAQNWSGSVTRQDAAQWIDDQPQPFFACVNFNAPHFPYQVPPFELLSAETRAVLGDPASCGGPFCPGQIAGTASPCGTSPCGDLTECVSMQRRLFYNAMLEAVDTEIGNLLAGMSAEKRARTLVIVMGDNGTPGVVLEPLLHGGGKGTGKGTMSELGVRVPMIVAGRPVPPGGHVSEALVHAVDLWRTVAQLSGAKESLAAPLTPLDSRSFAHVLEHPGAPSRRDEIFCQGFVRPGHYDPTDWGPYEPACSDPSVPGVYFCVPRSLGGHGRSLCDGQYKLIVAQTAPGIDVAPPGTADVRPQYTEELYDLLADPEESIDLMPQLPGNPTLAAVHAQLRARMTQLSGY
jgi:arylsulfatase A-like enzyme